MPLPIDLSENLGSINKIIIVEDAGTSVGKGLILAKFLLHQFRKSDFEEVIVANEVTWQFEKQIEVNDVKDISKLILQHNSCPKAVVMISLTALLFENSLRDVTQLLHLMRNQTCAVIGVIHGDCHAASDIAILKNKSDLWLKVVNSDFKRTTLIKTHPRGKIEQSFYDLKVTGNELHAANVSKSTEKASVSSADASEEVLPQSSFNLTLSQKEKDDRSNLELPFWKDSQKESKIEYIPDENDDWDDEDPDEDLDF